MSREMKNSGIPWIGDIPKGWKKIRIKHIFEIIGGNGFKEKYQGNICGDYPFYKTSDINADCDYVSASTNYVDSEVVDMENYNIVPVNSIVVSKIGAAMRKNHRKITTCDCCIDNNLQALHPIRAVDDIKYLYYLLKVVNFEWFDNNGTIPSVNNAKLKDLYVPWISFPEQQKIASFLDRKCSEIDEMIALQEKIVEELKAYKQSVITEAVTKGLNPDVPMKDSGIEWIGEIPERWEVRRIKYIGKAENGLTYTPSDVCDASEGVLVLRSSNVQNGKLVFEDNVYVRSAPTSLMVKVGDIIICSRNGSASLVGKSAVVENDLTASFGAFMMRFRSNHNYKYINFLLTSTISHYKQLFTTTTINQLTIGLINNIAMPFIESKEEQQAIADYLDTKCTEIDNLISIKLSKIDSLKEYKKSIIYEYVTGKKEVI